MNIKIILFFSLLTPFCDGNILSGDFQYLKLKSATCEFNSKWVKNDTKCFIRAVGRNSSSLNLILFFVKPVYYMVSFQELMKKLKKHQKINIKIKN
jgi:hypothetical protein